MRGSILTTLAASALLAGTAAAQPILVQNDIAVSETWTSGNSYLLSGQIYVLPGATLTIEPGTVIFSNTALLGALAVTRGGQIDAQGTVTDPIIMTSANDIATWDPDPSHPTGRDPKTGTWREASNEMGGLAILGNAYIATNGNPANVATPSAANEATLEGLVATGPGDSRPIYGGGDDSDDSGVVTYFSLRYGGRVIGLANELNGITLGGLGRETDMHHIEVMNNVDDGIEIFGGTLSVSHINIWNIGDDAFDCDQGWRGRAQNILLVQGYSTDDPQGSGVGDNNFEIDGAEDSDWQPRTESLIYNATVIGQPEDGDGGTAWRDNAAVQYRNCIFMDLGERLVRFDNVDGDGANGYGHNGTLAWPAYWTTASNGFVRGVNAGNPAGFLGYDIAQNDGNLNEIGDSVFFNNNASDAYTTAASVGVVDMDPPAAGLQSSGNVVASASPITSITRAALVVRGGKDMRRVTSLNPLPANDALVSAAAAPQVGVLQSQRYRGAFAPNANWLTGWTAADAFGFNEGDSFSDLGLGANAAGSAWGAPTLGAAGTFSSGQNVTFSVNAGPLSTQASLLIGTTADLSGLNPVVNPLFDTQLSVDLGTAIIVPMSGSAGSFSANINIPGTLTVGSRLAFEGICITLDANQLVNDTQAMFGIVE